MYLFSIEHYCHDWSISQFPQQFAQNPWHISHLLLSWLETFVLERCCVKLVILQQILHSAQPPFICLFCFHFTVMGWRVDVKRNTSEQKFYYYNWKIISLLHCSHYFFSWLVLIIRAYQKNCQKIWIKSIIGHNYWGGGMAPWPPSIYLTGDHAIFKVNWRDKSKKWIIKSKCPAVC